MIPCNLKVKSRYNLAVKLTRLFILSTLFGYGVHQDEG